EENGESMYKIIELRLKEKNMKPRELANKAGISTGTLSDLKSGRLKKPSFELLEKIADVLEMDMNDFRKNERDKGEMHKTTLRSKVNHYLQDFFIFFFLLQLSDRKSVM